MDDMALRAGAKGLNETKGASTQDSLKYDKDTAAAFAKLYTDNDGDTTKIFEKLGENPYKVNKYPPNDAEEFGRKYAQGFYEYLGKAEAKGDGDGAKGSK